MILQRDYSLPVIEIRVLDTAGMPDAAIRLILNAEGHREILDSRTVPLDAFGLGDDAEPDLAVPAELCAWIGHWSDQHVDPHDALWLSLVKPYGELGTIPWERDVQPAIARPLLRLPDALPEADRATSVLNVALVVTTGP